MEADDRPPLVTAKPHQFQVEIVKSRNHSGCLAIFQQSDETICSLWLATALSIRVD
jgi:hypothetical protein